MVANVCIRLAKAHPTVKPPPGANTPFDFEHELAPAWASFAEPWLCRPTAGM
jgi:hypothetical protein